MGNVTTGTIVELPIDLLTKDPNHPRQDLGNLNSILESMRKDGQQVPINVNQAVLDGTLYVNDGMRRIEVLKMMGQEMILCMVHKGYSPEEAARQSFVINTERSELTPIEIALHLQKMNSQFGLSFRDLEIKGYGSAGQISKKIQLLNLPEEVQDKITKEHLTMAHGEALLKLETKKEMNNMAKRAIDHGWSAKTTEKAVRRYNQKKNQPPVQKVSIPDQEIPGVYFKNSKDMSELGDKSVGLIFTSPPYFMGMEFEQGYNFDDHLDNIEAVMKESARVIVPGGIIAINLSEIYNFKGKKGDQKKAHIELMAHRYQQFLKKHGVDLESQIIWVKSIHAYSTDRSRAFSSKTNHTEYKVINEHEFILVFRKNGERKAPSEEAKLASALTKEEWSKYIPSVWQIPQVWKSEGHPTVFPDELARRIIKMYSFVGEIVLDPFLGSGTTVKVARELSREGIGYEREEKYKGTILAKLGHTEPTEKKETLSEFVARNLKDLEDNQPAKPEVETLMSERMRESVEKILQGKELEMA